MSFSKWFSKWYDEIKDNHEYGFLIDMRHVNVHEKTTSMGSTASTTSTTYTTLTQHKRVRVPLGDVGIWWFFKENYDYDVEDVCKMYLDKLKKMVDDAKRKF